MNSPKFSVQWLQFIITVLSISGGTDARFENPRLSPIRGAILEQPDLLSSAPVSEDLQTFYYPQTLDHFNYRPESYTTFQQRYVMNFKHWGAANASAPILAYLGAEAPLDGDLAVIGFLSDTATTFNALQHRYYGKSIPFGSREEAFRNASTLGPLTSSSELKDKLGSMYASAAQYNRPPRYPVTVVCGGIDGSKEEDILSKILTGVVAYRGNLPCYINPSTNESETARGWRWQVYIYRFFLSSSLIFKF
ncbi:hypothetical protein PTKIN_Ptkin03bG0058100 [Pterospermum kingtungense]